MASDDFVLSSLRSLGARALVVALLLTAVVRNAPCAEVLDVGAIVACGVNVVGVVIDAALGWSSSRGTIPQLDRRRPVRAWVVARVVMLCADAASVVGLLVAVHAGDDSEACKARTEQERAADTTARIVAYATAVITAMQAVFVVGLVCSSHAVSKAGGAHHSSRWAARCSFLRCCCTYEGEAEGALVRAGAVVADTLHGSDRLMLSPTDVAAGMALVRLRQSQRRGGSPDATPPGPGPASLDFLTPERSLDRARWSELAVGAYGWALFVFMRPCCGLCALAAGSAEDACCRDRVGRCVPCGCRGVRRGGVAAARIAGLPAIDPAPIHAGDGGCCGCDATAARLGARVPLSSLVLASFRGSYESRPFFVARDEERRAVVVSVRGTMSLSDVVADTDARPVDIAPWAERWGLLGGTAPAGPWLVHRAIWTGALTIAQRLREAGALEAPGGGPGRAGVALPVRRGVPWPSLAEFQEAEPEAELEEGGVEGGGLAVPRAAAPSRGAAPQADHLSAAPGDVAVDVPPPPGVDDGRPWRLVVVGHSLGAGVATLLGVALSGRFPGLVVAALAPPGGLVSPALAAALEGTVTSVVIGRDVVPRLSLASARRMQGASLRELRSARVSKVRLLGSVAARGFAGCAVHAAGCRYPASATGSLGCPAAVCCGACALDPDAVLGPGAGAAHGDGPAAPSPAAALPPDADALGGPPCPSADASVPLTRSAVSAPPRLMPSGRARASASSPAGEVGSTRGFFEASASVIDEDDAASVDAGHERDHVQTMRMAGRVVHLERQPRREWGCKLPCQTRGGTLPYTAREASRDEFREIQVSSLMVRDHMPDKMMRVCVRAARE